MTSRTLPVALVLLVALLSALAIVAVPVQAEAQAPVVYAFTRA
jgi:hypothetical protein